MPNTNCRICGKLFAGPQFSGEDKLRLANLFEKVTKHLEKDHKGYVASSIIAAYVTDDPFLMQIQEAGRCQVHNQTRKNKVTDQQMRDKLAALDCTQADIAKLLPVMMDLRDCLTEQGRYAAVEVSLTT